MPPWGPTNSSPVRPGQCRAFLAAAAGDRLYAAWVLAIVCGMRRGELCGLKWSKVDLDSGVVHVHWQRAVANGMVDGGVVEKEPKGKSRRSIAIGPALVELLRAHRDRQRAEESAAGVAYRRGGYVFSKEGGTPYHPKYFTDRFWEGPPLTGLPSRRRILTRTPWLRAVNAATARSPKTHRLRSHGWPRMPNV